jgi:AcrR family transcriptional regulator
MPRPTFFNLPEDKRARIVELAIDEFAMHPYAEASLSRIVARAGIAKGSVYQYFEDKLDLYRWLLIEEVGRRKLAYAAPPAGAPPGDLFARLEAQCLAGLAFLRGDPRLARLASRVLDPAADPALQALHEEARRAGRANLAEELRSAQRRGELRPDIDVDLIAIALSALLGQALVDAVLDELGTDLMTLLREPHRAQALEEGALRRIVQQLLDLIERGLRAPAPQGEVSGRGRWSPTSRA